MNAWEQRMFDILKAGMDAFPTLGVDPVDIAPPFESVAIHREKGAWWYEWVFRLRDGTQFLAIGHQDDSGAWTRFHMKRSRCK